MLYYDPTDWETQIDPYPIYARLREEAPVYHNEKLGFWALSRFEDVWDAHLDHETFSSSQGPALEKGPAPIPMMIIMDPPAHTRVRQLVSKVFTPRRVAELEPTVRQITRDRLAGLEPGDQIDLFERLGSSMPMDVISTMLGVPAEDRDRIRHLTNAGMHREGGLGVPASAMSAMAEVKAYYVDFIKERQARPARRPAQRPDRRRVPPGGRLAHEARLRRAARLLPPARQRRPRDHGAPDLQQRRDAVRAIPISGRSS